MAPAKTLNTTVILDNNNYQFKVNGQIITFDGYLKVYGEYEDTKDQVLPTFNIIYLKMKNIIKLD